MRQLLALTAALLLVGCGQAVSPVSTTPVTTAKAQSTTVPIGPVDLQGRVMSLTPSGSDLRVVVQPERSSELVTVLVDTQVKLRVVRGERAGIDGLALSYLQVGYDVRVQYAPGASPRRARAIFWDLTGVPI